LTKDAQFTHDCRPFPQMHSTRTAVFRIIEALTTASRNWFDQFQIALPLGQTEG